MSVICATLVHGTLGSATSPIAAEPDWEKQRLRWKRLAGRGWEGGVGSERTAATGTLGNLVRFLFFFQMQISSVSTTTNGVTDQKIRKP